LFAGIESNDERSQDGTNPIIVGLMILLAAAMALIAIIAIIAIVALVRRRATGYATLSYMFKQLKQVN